MINAYGGSMNYYIVDNFYEDIQFNQIECHEFVNITKGRSIISVSDLGSNRFDIELSGNLLLRFSFGRDNDHISIVNTTTKEEIQPIILSLGDMPKNVSLKIIEKKIKGLRTLYAILYLLQAGREAELESFITKHPYGDIESHLLIEDEKLKIQSISYGSWLLTIWAKTKDAFSAIKSIVFLVFERGREAYLQRMEAEANIAKEKSIQESLETARKEFELQRSRMDYVIELSNKMQVPEVKQILQKKILESINLLILDDKQDRILRN